MTSLDDLWTGWMAEARSRIQRPRRQGDEAATAAAYELAHPTRLEQYTPPSLAASEPFDRELMSQTAYTAELERMLLTPSAADLEHGARSRARAPTRSSQDGAARPASAGAASDIYQLRSANQVLTAKSESLQGMLDAAHARCRRSEEINAQWRQQHAQLRQREREAWARLCAAELKVERTDALLGQVGKLREQLRVINAERTAWRNRCDVLERTVAHQRALLASLLTDGGVRR